MSLVQAVVTQDQWALCLGVWLVTHLVQFGQLTKHFAEISLIARIWPEPIGFSARQKRAVPPTARGIGPSKYDPGDNLVHRKSPLRCPPVDPAQLDRPAVECSLPPPARVIPKLNEDFIPLIRSIRGFTSVEVGLSAKEDRVGP